MEDQNPQKYEGGTASFHQFREAKRCIRLRVLRGLEQTAAALCYQTPAPWRLVPAARLTFPLLLSEGTARGACGQAAG
jgi:hypothetical protein